MSEGNFVPNEILAGRSIRFWAQFTEEELLNDWALNEKQIANLKAQLAHIDLSILAKPKMVAQAEERKAAGVSIPGLDEPEEEKAAPAPAKKKPAK